MTQKEIIIMTKAKIKALLKDFDNKVKALKGSPKK
jgi:hypothetical protein